MKFYDLLAKDVSVSFLPTIFPFYGEALMEMMQNRIAIQFWNCQWLDASQCQLYQAHFKQNLTAMENRAAAQVRQSIRI